MALHADDATTALTQAGYELSNIVKGYRYTCRAGNGDLQNRTATAVAFSAAPHTLRTACIAVVCVDGAEAVPEVLSSLRFLASPLAIVSTPQRVELFDVPLEVRAAPIPLAGEPHESWRQLLTSRPQAVSPAAVEAKKREGYQLTLGQGLIGWAEGITARTLAELLERLLLESIEALSPDSPLAREALLRLVFHLFACRVLEDKGLIAPSRDPVGALTTAHDEFSTNIDPSAADAPGVSAHTLHAVYGTLWSRFAFASLTPEMLGHAYETALVTPALRRQQGIYYTPRILATHILDRLPIEVIPEADRSLLDPCCGSGSFLLAGFERLAALLPSGLSPRERHAYLRARILGSDNDGFAREIAQLSLVLADVYNKNGWRVVGSNTENALPRWRRRPTIIATNPPFGEVKAGGPRRERASDILTKLIDALQEGGVLGIVLPLSFLDAKASAAARSMLLRDCDILEVNIFPGGLFKSGADTVAMMCRKRSKPLRSAPDSFATVRELRAKDLQLFRQARSFTQTYSVDTARWASDAQHRFVISPLEDLWKRLGEQCRSLGSVATLSNGLQVHREDSDSVRGAEGSDVVPYVNRLSSLRPFALLSAPSSWLRYGPHLRRPGNEVTFKAQKVLINATRNPGSPWRLVAAVDRHGIYFSDHFHGVVPKGEVTVEEVAAILNSPVANAWFDAHCRSRKIVLDVLRRLPVPTFEPAMRSEVVGLVQKLERVVSQRWNESRDQLFYDVLVEDDAVSTTLLRRLDDLVCEAYQLGIEDRRNILKMMAGERRPQ